jgi:capsular polysaccharide transport system permease protein
MPAARSPLLITWEVWWALFLREAVQRLFAKRAAWLWLLLEPISHIVLLMFVFGAVRVRVIGGIDTLIWLMVGLLTFLLFRRSGTQGLNAIEANRALFSYRQVKPVDTVLSRAVLEFLLMALVATVLFAGVALWGLDVVPADPVGVAVAVFGVWLLGVGFGLMGSVAKGLVPEAGNLIGLSMMPLYLLSGVIFPPAAVPQPYREWLLYNPILHGVESARLAFAPYYQVAPETSLPYVYGFALVMIWFGLALQVRYAVRLASQ